MTVLTLSFQETQFDVVDRNNSPWLRQSEIARVLYGVKKGGGQSDAPFENAEKALKRLYTRNADEFSDAMTALVELETNGGKQKVRIFSLRGCHLLAMFARTKVAKEFRKWVLDILDKEVKQQSVNNPGALISIEQQGILFNLMGIRFPEGKDRHYGWSRFNRHFVVNSYKNLPADKFAQACCYIPAMPDKTVKALPAPQMVILTPPKWTRPDPAGTEGAIRDLKSVKHLICELQIWANGLPPDIGHPLWDALDDLDKLMATSYTEITEAMIRFDIGIHFLNRWLGRRRNKQIGNVG